MQTVESADGTKIAFDRSGEGLPLILIVGAFSDRSSTKSLATGLAPAFTLYEYDRRGRGDSGDTPPYAIEHEVDDLAALVIAAGGSASVFGHSSGGALALEAAAAGVPIDKLAVYEPPYTEGPTAEVAAQLSELVTKGRTAEATQRFLALMGTTPETIDQMKAGPYWTHMESYAPTLPYEVTLCNGGVVPIDRLSKITAPTLVLAGGASPAWASESTRAVASSIPGSEQRVLEGQGHGAADDILTPVLTEFFT